MLPLLTGKGRVVLYLLLWVQISGLLVALLALSRTLPVAEAAALAVPLAAVFAFECIGVHFLARAVPVRSGALNPIATHVGAAVVSASLWVLMGRAWVEVLSRLAVAGAPALFSPPGETYARAAPIVFAVGLLLLLLCLALHHLLIAVDDSRQAETRAVQAQLHSREAELKSLRAQLHPHFLFNSLNSISALIPADPAAARRTCLQLGELLRRSLSLATRDRIPLQEELALVESLLSIEKVRFGDRLDYRLDVDGEARECPLPPLLLQPLVENAVTHGIAGLLDGGTVAIEGRRAGSRLKLAVDNPVDPETPPRRGSGVGLENVRRRLAAIYGLEAGMEVHREPERFRVELDVPLPAPAEG